MCSLQRNKITENKQLWCQRNILYRLVENGLCNQFWETQHRKITTLIKLKFEMFQLVWCFKTKSWRYVTEICFSFPPLWSVVPSIRGLTIKMISLLGHQNNRIPPTQSQLTILMKWLSFVCSICESWHSKHLNLVLSPTSGHNIEAFGCQVVLETDEHRSSSKLSGR